MKKRFTKMTFSDQIKSYYVMLFLVIFVICTVIYMVITRSLISSSEDNTLEYGLMAAENNLESLVENVNDYSKVIAYNDVIQESLQKDSFLSYEDKVALQETVIQMAACCEGVSSIYLFDNKGESYVAGSIYEVDAIRTYLKDTLLYQSALGEENENTSGGIIFSYQTYLDEEKQIISFVRVVRKLDTLDAIGVLAMNIPVNRITETYRSVANQTGMEFAVLDKEGNVISASSEGEWMAGLTVDIKLTAGKEDYRTINRDGQKYKVGKIDEEDGSWSIVAVMPRSQTTGFMQKYLFFMAFIILFGMAMCLLGASFITSRIKNPLVNILKSMGHVKESRLERVPVLSTNQEMDELQQHYNQMLDEIEELMTKKVEEQRLRKKYELSLLQAQIKPHFLYNTFDSVCALAMLGRTDDVYTMMQALGQYYRNSLHKGQEIITVKEELNIVHNYLIIQSYRYDDVFETVYDVDESVNSCRMIKLILQPLVENAIYHGFREHELSGTITIRAKDKEDFVMLQVEDDGIGMEREKLLEVMSRTDENEGKRFGLFGTFQRIRLYYQQYQQEEKELVEIKSERGKGTLITVWIPKDMGDEEC